MILISDDSVFTLKTRGQEQGDTFLVLTKICTLEGKTHNASSLENGGEIEGRGVEIHKDGTVNILAFCTDPVLTIKCDPDMIYARFLSETSVYEVKIVNEGIEIKRLAKFWPTRGEAPVGETIRGDRIYANIYGNLAIYEGNEEIELFSIREFF